MHSTNDIDDGYMGSGDLIRSSIRHYGRDNHCKEILEYFENRESLCLREKEIVNEVILLNPLCLNLVEGGEGGFPLSEEHLKKFSQAGNEAFRRKLEDPDYKERFIANTFRNSSPKETGIKGATSFLEKLEDLEWRKNFSSSCSPSEEGKLRIGESNSILQKGEKNSQYGRYWVYKGEEILRIDARELDKYLKTGWKRGKNEKQTRVWIYKDTERKKISSSNLAEYLKLGWITKKDM